MGAALRYDDRRVMSELLLWLIAHRYPRELSSLHCRPKEYGNPILGDEVALQAGYICLLRKHDQERRDLEQRAASTRKIT